MSLKVLYIFKIQKKNCVLKLNIHILNHIHQFLYAVC